MSTELKALTDEYRQDYYNFCKKGAEYPYLFSEDTFDWLWQKVKDPDERHFIIFEDGEKAGFCEAHFIGDDAADIGVEIEEQYRRRGIGKRAAELLMEHDDIRGFERIYWKTFANNEASVRLAEALGGQIDHVERLELSGHVEGEVTELDILVYRLR
ncbi:MAG: GNAT family N-acetyltransferase [Lachnospiraceae bacterium]|nr:GNAT family N-acetyltransferase [Lachnospiraceae bacterium]